MADDVPSREPPEGGAAVEPPKTIIRFEIGSYAAPAVALAAEDGNWIHSGVPPIPLALVSTQASLYSTLPAEP